VGLDNNNASLLELAKDIKTEECTTAQEVDNADSKVQKNNEIKGWVDKVEALTAEECEDLEESIRPAKQILVKVRGSQCCISCAEQVVPAMETCLQDCAFNNNLVASMEVLP